MHPYEKLNKLLCLFFPSEEEPRSCQIVPSNKDMVECKTLKASFPNQCERKSHAFLFHLTPPFRGVSLDPYLEVSQVGLWQNQRDRTVYQALNIIYS